MEANGTAKILRKDNRRTHGNKWISLFSSLRRDILLKFLDRSIYMSDCLGTFKECKSCAGSSTHEPCAAERRVLGGIIAKLNLEEKIMLAQLFGKTREAGETEMLEIIRTMYHTL